MAPNQRPGHSLSLLFLSFFLLPVNAILPLNTYNATNSSDWMAQSWFWDQHLTSQAVPVPVTQQCETVHFTWNRNGATGPDSTAPYTIQIYTSAFVFPFVLNAGSSLTFDWQVPFGPGTLWQGCMFDAFGNTGGCREIHTMIPGSSNCKNATFPLGPLDVEAKVNNGPLSQYGWVDQCTDIQLTPKNGTPPYVMTIAPSLHPPLNFTLKDNKPRNWTVTLSWASPFFISMVDSAGNFWANGPLHSGGGGSTACLSNFAALPDTSGSSRSGIKAGAAIGAAFGGLIAGILAGLAAAFVFFNRKKAPVYGEKRGLEPADPTSPLRSVSSRNNLIVGEPSGDDTTLEPATVGSGGIFGRLRGGTQPTIQPFTERSQPQTVQKLQGGRDDAIEMQTSPTLASDGAGPSRSNQIYVVHHDGGRAPVTVYHADGTQVVELPPRYANNAEGLTPASASRSSEDATRAARYSTTSAATTSASSDPSDVPVVLSPLRRPSAISKPSQSTTRSTTNRTIPEGRDI